MCKHTKVKPSSVDRNVLDETAPVFSFVALIIRLPFLSSTKHCSIKIALQSKISFYNIIKIVMPM